MNNRQKYAVCMLEEKIRKKKPKLQMAPEKLNRKKVILTIPFLFFKYTNKPIKNGNKKPRKKLIL